MGRLYLVEHATDDQTFIAPVKLEGFTEFKVQRYEGEFNYDLREV